VGPAIFIYLWTWVQDAYVFDLPRKTRSISPEFVGVLARKSSYKYPTSSPFFPLWNPKNYAARLTNFSHRSSSRPPRYFVDSGESSKSCRQILVSVDSIDLSQRLRSSYRFISQRTVDFVHFRRSPSFDSFAATVPHRPEKEKTLLRPPKDSPRHAIPRRPLRRAQERPEQHRRGRVVDILQHSGSTGKANLCTAYIR
jgi:hypothetical protein